MSKHSSPKLEQGLEKGTSEMWGQAAVHENIEFKIDVLFKIIEKIFAENDFSRHHTVKPKNLLHCYLTDRHDLVEQGGAETVQISVTGLVESRLHNG